MRYLQVVLRCVAWGATAWCAVGAILQATFRDRPPILSAVYYASPAGVLAISAIAGAAAWAGLRRRRMALVMGAAAIVCIVGWQRVSFYENDQPDRAADLEMVFWNVARGKHDWPAVMQNLRRQQAPLIGVVEANSRVDNTPQRWRDAFPEYAQTDLQGGMLLLCRGKILEVNNGRLGLDGYFKRVLVEINRWRINVVLIDLNADPFISRQDALQRLADRLPQWSDKPLIIMGDFNTPAGSAHFEPLRERLVHSFEAAGEGYAPTWPLPAPVLMIDHIWLGPGVIPVASHAGWAKGSDHRHLWLSVRFDEPWKTF